MKTHFYLVLFLILVSNATLSAQEPTIEALMESKVLPEDPQEAVIVDGIELFSQTELPKFYTNRDFELAWNSTKNKKDLIESLESSFDEGLDPQDYHLEKIKNLLEKSKKGKLTNATVGRYGFAYD